MAPLSWVTKSMMFQYFGTFDHFSQLTENEKQKFWQRFCRFANVCRRHMSGCTQLVQTDADARVRNFLEMMTLMNVDRRGTLSSSRLMRPEVAFGTTQCCPPISSGRRGPPQSPSLGNSARQLQSTIVLPQQLHRGG